ncbi:MAG: DMT family transporter [Alphaproteobacteria bacterium]|nr:DMT family transporter [Alphaproteobacteria bacterium]
MHAFFHGSNARAVGFLMISNVVFTVVELFGKQLVAGEGISPLQILCLRGLLSMMVVPILARQSPRRLLRTRYPGKQVLRSVLIMVAGLGFFFALEQVPLADAVAIVFVSPLIITAIAAVGLREAVGWRRWSACAVGFVGALLIIQPGMAGRHWMYALPLIDALASAVYSVLTRMVGRDDGPWCCLFYSVMASGLLLALAMPWIWVSPSPAQWGMLLGVAVAGLIGHFFHIRAFSEGESSLMAPLSYVHVVFTTVAAFVVFGTLPDAVAMVGVALIVGGGLYVFHREATKRPPT